MTFLPGGKFYTAFSPIPVSIRPDLATWPQIRWTLWWNHQIRPDPDPQFFLKAPKSDTTSTDPMKNPQDQQIHTDQQYIARPGCLLITDYSTCNEVRPTDVTDLSSIGWIGWSIYIYIIDNCIYNVHIYNMIIRTIIVFYNCYYVIIMVEYSFGHAFYFGWKLHQRMVDRRLVIYSSLEVGIPSTIIQLF
jgi:hypothetical protein